MITLGIIGVVAAITLPNLIMQNKAARLRSQFLKSYSTIQQTYQLMIELDESVINSDYDPATFYKTFSKHLKVALDCGNYYTTMSNKTPCYAPNTGVYTYKSLDGTVMDNPGERLLDDGIIVLMDGTLIFFENNKEEEKIFISVDLNGITGKPNMWGYDLFTFQLIDEKIKPMGDIGTAYSEEEYCDITKKSSLNGIACAKLAITQTDYFKNIVKKIK